VQFLSLHPPVTVPSNPSGDGYLDDREGTMILAGPGLTEQLAA